MPSNATSLIYELGTIFVAVSDQDRALEFYTRTLGFEKRADFLYGGDHRWIELAPPGAKNTISLVPPGEGRAAALRGSLRVRDERHRRSPRDAPAGRRRDRRRGRRRGHRQNRPDLRNGARS